MDDMNNSKFCTQCIKCYEQVRFMDDLNNSKLWAHGYRCYKQLKVVVDDYYSKSAIW